MYNLRADHQFLQRDDDDRHEFGDIGDRAAKERTANPRKLSSRNYAVIFRTQGAVYKYLYRTRDGVGIEELCELTGRSKGNA